MNPHDNDEGRLDGRRGRKTAEKRVVHPQAAASFTLTSTHPTCRLCLAEEVTAISVGPDLRTLTVRCVKCGYEAVLVVSDD
jgi:hypothetical protein